jgi:hypothetical protein
MQINKTDETKRDRPTNQQTYQQTTMNRANLGSGMQVLGDVQQTKTWQYFWVG